MTYFCVKMTSMFCFMVDTNSLVLIILTDRLLKIISRSKNKEHFRLMLISVLLLNDNFFYWSRYYKQSHIIQCQYDCDDQHQCTN